MDHDVIKDVVRALQSDLDSLQAARHSQDVQDRCPSQSAIGDYTAGEGLYGTVTAARNGVTSIYDQFVVAYESVIQALQTSEQNHRKADEDTKVGIRRVGLI